MTTELDCSIGLSVAESTFGTPVTVSKFLEFTAETLDWNPTFVQGAGLRVGSRTPRAARRGLGRQMAGGDVTVECGSKGLGALLQAALGNVTTTQRATTGVYQQNHTPLTSDPVASYTLQKGIPPFGGGATSAFTIPGAVCSGFQLNVPNADTATLQTSWVGREVRTDVAYAAPSYPTPVELLRFVGAAITLGGSVTGPTTTALATGGTAVVNVRDAQLTFDNGLDDAGFNLGGGGKRSRKPLLGVAAISGQLTVEYADNVVRDALLNQSHLALVLTLQGLATIGSGSDVPALQIFVPDIVFESELPKVGGAGPVTATAAFTGMDNLSATQLQVAYVSTDTAP